MITRIHINGHKLRSNRTHDRFEPVITAKTSRSNCYGYQVDILDKEGNVVASVVQSRKPLSCGAVVWVETELATKTHAEEII